MTEVMIDTNILIRYLIQDNQEQFRITKALFTEIEAGRKTGYFSILVIQEALWILEQYYNLKRTIFIPQLLALFQLQGIKVLEVNKRVVSEILSRMETTTIGFTDHYLAAQAQGRAISSFDKDFQRLARA